LFVGNNFIYGISGVKDGVNTHELKTLLQKKNDKIDVKSRDTVSFNKPDSKAKTTVNDI